MNDSKNVTPDDSIFFRILINLSFRICSFLYEKSDHEINVNALAYFKQEDE